MEEETLMELHAFFYGRVQGVFFRATTRDIAKRAGINGTVRNLADGSVELIAQGSQEELEALVLKLSQNFYLDPSLPYKVTYGEPSRDFNSFEIIY